MQSPDPLAYLVRHGQTAWSVSGQHTGLTDIALTQHGEEEAVRLGDRLRGLEFAGVLSSPLQRASRTCELAGFGESAIVDPDLVEWDYGDYEGILRADILAKNPEWRLFRDGCPGGESPAQVAARADRIVSRVRALKGNALVFSSGHFLRMLAARWLDLPPLDAAHLVLSTASLSILGYEHDLSEPAIRLWNVSDQSTGLLRPKRERDSR